MKIKWDSVDKTLSLALGIQQVLNKNEESEL